jgi:hypothetical protein
VQAHVHRHDYLGGLNSLASQPTASVLSGSMAIAHFKMAAGRTFERKFLISSRVRRFSGHTHRTFASQARRRLAAYEFFECTSAI